MATIVSTSHQLRRPRPDRRRTPRSKPKLRIALFADGPTQPRWMVDALAKIARSDFAELVLIAVSPREKAPLPFLWRVYSLIDQWIFGPQENLSEPTDLRLAMPTIRYQVIPPPSKGNVGTGWHEVASTDPHLDVAFVLGELDDAEFENIAKFGIWRYCFGTKHGTREDLAGWREVTQGDAVTTSGLRVHLWPGVNRLLYQSHSRTYPLSVLKNRANLLPKMALFAERELRMLRILGGTQLKHRALLSVAGSIGTEKPPNTVEILGALIRFGGRVARRALQKLLTIDQWFIAFRFGTPNWDGDLAKFIRLQPPKDRIWADPFPLYRDGRYFIFFEEVLFATGKGHIAMIEVDRSGGHTDPIKVLECSYHLSYPFLIEQDGDLFMVPESGENRSIDLYRCIQFPDVWRLEKTLLKDVACADATFHRASDRWWMFVNIGAKGTELYDELHLFHADNLLGEWQPHVRNPVKSDVFGARPAGRLFMHEGALHRPAQICAPLYGSGIVISKILQLTPRHYQEEEVARLLPSLKQGTLGIHTLNCSGELNVIDGFNRRSRM